MENAQETSKADGKLKGFQIVSLLTLLSRITGLGRDALMASVFGTGWILDAFTLAFRVPNMFRRLFGDGAMTAAFLPEFVKADQQGGRNSAREVFNGVAWKLLGILLFSTVLAEAVVAVIYLTCDISARSSMLCQLTLILLPYLVLICMSSLYSAALNGVHHFTVPALAPVALNIIWLLGGILAARWMETAADEVRIISFFILLGGVAQLAMVVWRAHHFDIRMSRHSIADQEAVRPVFKAMGPVLIGLTVGQINGLVDGVLAWFLSSGGLLEVAWMADFRLPLGTASALYLGQRLFQFPMGIFAVALGTVLFPRFARHAQAGDTSELNRDVIHGLQLVLVVAIPASVGLWFMAPPITNLLFRYGQFGSQAAAMTSDMISANGLGVWVFSGLLIVNRVFYAVNDQITPMRQGVICVGLNLLFDFVLLPLFGGQGLPLAGVLAACFQLGLAVEVLHRRFLKIEGRDFVPLLFRVAIGTLIMQFVGLATIFGTQWLVGGSDDPMPRLLKVVLPILTSVATYAVVLTQTGISLSRLTRESYRPGNSENSN
ncbi:MAG: murein biosynthesis integral membrane protein MurJ [Planctomycetaceae bacterium]